MKELELGIKYKGVRVTEIIYSDWDNELFLYDPSRRAYFGILRNFPE
ncbi:MAG: hypothetical protein QMB24_04350 [Spirosomataceae bacterium]